MTQSTLQAATPPTTTTAAEVLSGVSAAPAQEKTDSGTDAALEAPAKPGEEKLSPKLQVLLKRERAALEREKAARDLEASIKEREAKITEFESLKKTNPMKALELLGLNYQELTEVALADGNVPADIKLKQLEEKFESKFKASEDEKRRQLEDAEKQHAQKMTKVIEDFKTEIGAHLKENAERYELITFEQNEELVYDVIEEHFERTKDPETGIGETMSIKDAADKVEEFLEKKYSKVKDLKKVQSFLTPKAAPSEKPTNKPTGQTPKTLNNNLSATPAKPRLRPITDDERVAKAIAYARGLRPQTH